MALRYSVIFVGAVLFCWGWYGQIDLAVFGDKDLRHYRDMAAAAPDLAWTVRAPFGFRILPPWLAGLWPGGLDAGFKWGTLLTIGGLAVLWVHWLAMWGLSCVEQGVGLLWLLFNPHFVGFPAFNPYQWGDVLTMVLILGMTLSLLKNKYGQFGFLLIIGAMTREANLLMLPVAVWYFYKNRAGIKDVWGVVLLPILALIVFLGIRAGVRVENHDWHLWGAFSIYARQLADPVAWGRLLLNAYAPFSLLLFVWYKPFLRLLKSHPVWGMFGGLVWISCFFGQDKERLLAPTFFLIYSGILWLLRQLPENQRMIGYWITTCAAFLTSWHHLVARFPVFPRGMYFVLSAFLTFVLGFWAWKWKDYLWTKNEGLLKDVGFGVEVNKNT